MDLCSSCRLKKCSRGKRLSEDHLSSLPDDILLFILSFLTYKEVVKTSILSCRWLKLRKYFLALHFYEPVPKAVVGKRLATISDRKRRRYVKGVNRVLRKHKAPYLKEFKIICDLDQRNQEDIDNWLVFAFAGVYNLALHFHAPVQKALVATSVMERRYYVKEFNRV